MIKARDLIKKEQVFQVGDDTYTNLKLACENVAYSALYKLNIPLSTNLNRLVRLTNRLEREFLRGEVKKEKDNKIYLVCSNDGVIHKAFTTKEGANKLILKAYAYQSIKPPHDHETVKQYQERHNAWVRNHPLFNGHNAPDITHTVLNVKEFELIDFKPLEVESD